MSPAKTASKGSDKVFSKEELAAARETARERRIEARRSPEQKKALGEKDLLDKVAAMPKADREIAERLHAIVTRVAPELLPKTWYGMPAWATPEGKVVCFFKAASKFGQRFATFGFEEDGVLDEGNMWATSWGITKMTPAEEKKVAALVKKAVS
jgi:hypothetical protein